jgi:hypothetical protein
MILHPACRTVVALSSVALFVAATPASAQWLTQPTTGIPRSADGKADLSAPAPRTADGKPDLSGLWEAVPRYESDFKSADALVWAREQAQSREANPASDSWSTLCLPPGPMITFSGPLRIVQTPTIVAILFEVPNNFRQIFMDGRSLPNDPNPTWQGYSVGRWDGDTLVVDTIGFNDKSMVGRPGYPHTEALHVTERYRRRDFGHIDVQMIIDDPKAFTRPWTIITELAFSEDNELLEYVCNENERSRQHFVQPSSTGSAEIRVDPALLARYAGVYRVMTPLGPANATVSVDGDQLTIDVPGRGSGRMVPQSTTMFSFRGAIIEFVPDDKGDVTHVVVRVVEGDFKGPRVTTPTR